jgi:DNA-binding transcriptional MerR regulator
MDVMASLEVLSRSGHPDFLDLPWNESLRYWSGGRLVDIARGVSRHVVRFVDYDGVVYAIKETTPDNAQSEYDLLRQLADRGLPVVEAVGVVRNRAVSVGVGGSHDAPGLGYDDHESADVRGIGEPVFDLDRGAAAALVTRHLSFSLPYRYLFLGRGITDLKNRLLDALAVLLVRLHLEGFFWGDCSLSNTLFRHDAGALTAYLVDAETGTLRSARMSDGQRDHDLSIAADNVGGELLDLEAAGSVDESFDPAEVGHEIRARYERLWAELTREDVIEIGNRHQLASRIRRLNQLGFDVAEVRTSTSEDGQHLRVVPRVVEAGHHRKRLQQLTGLDVDENQARRLINDLEEHRTDIAHQQHRNVPDALAAYDWLTNVYEPTIGAIPEELRSRMADAEAFHQILEHRWYLSEAAGHDVGMDAAVTRYIEDILPHAPEEEAILPGDLPDPLGHDTIDDVDDDVDDDADDDADVDASDGATA